MLKIVTDKPVGKVSQPVMRNKLVCLEKCVILVLEKCGTCSAFNKIKHGTKKDPEVLTNSSPT